MSDRKKGSIYTKIVSGVMIETTLLLLALGATIFMRIKPLNDDTFTEKLSTVMRLTDSTISAFLEGMNNSVLMLSNETEDVDSEDVLYTTAKMVTESNRFIKSASIIFDDDTCLSYPDDSMTTDFAKDAEWWDAALNQEGIPYFSALYENLEGEPVMAAAVTLPNGNGIAAIEIDPEAFIVLLGDETTMGDVTLIVMDANANVVLDPYDPVVAYKHCSTFNIPSLQNFFAGAYGVSRERVLDGRMAEVRILPSQNDYCILDYAMIISTKVMNASTNAVLHLLIIAVVSGMVISVLISILMGKSIANPLLKLIEILKNISEGDGDLTVRIPEDSNDEIGTMAQYFNLTLEKLAASLKSVITESQNMKNTSENLVQSIEDSSNQISGISSNIQQIKGDVQNQNSSVQEANNTINRIASNIGDLNESIIHQAESVSQSSSAVEQMVANIASVTSILEKNQNNVRLLSDSAEQGKEIIDKTVEMANKIARDSEVLIETSSIIQNIAEQTNLLAMNAAIEAAHAGESGKGFAVVADEIRKLAEDSNAQGKKIGEILEEFRGVITQMTSDSAELQSSFDTIFEHTQTVSEQESVIKNAMDEQKSGSDQVLQAMRSINLITGDVKNSSQSIEQGSKEILTQMEQVKNITEQINSSMIQINSGVENLSETMRSVNEVTEENTVSISKVSEEISAFKVE